MDNKGEAKGDVNSLFISSHWLVDGRVLTSFNKIWMNTNNFIIRRITDFATTVPEI